MPNSEQRPDAHREPARNAHPERRPDTDPEPRTDAHREPHRGALPLRWKDLRAERPRIRPREAARRLGVTEAELLDSLVGRGVTRLRGPWIQLLRALEPLGAMMGLSRNEHCVIEKDGIYRRVEDFGPMGQVLDEGIDLRLFLTRWGSAYLVRDDESYGLRRSIQFFDIHGDAIHKAYPRGEDDDGQGDPHKGTQHPGLDDLLAKMADPDQEPGLLVRPPVPVPPPRPDDDVDRRGLREAWLALEDTHDFHRLLQQFGVQRPQALRLAGRDLAWPVSTGAHRGVLEGAAAQSIPLMVFVGNRGVVQIHSGVVKHLKAVGAWYNVLDPGFNLHLREKGIHSAWVVRKPTATGMVTALELYDDEGVQIALITGKRPRGQEERPEWRVLVEGTATPS